MHARLKAMVQLDIGQGFQTIVRLISFVQKEREWQKKLIAHPGAAAVRVMERVSEQKTWIFKIHVKLDHACFHGKSQCIEAIDMPK